MQDCEEALKLKSRHQKCAKRRVDALHALGYSRAAYQASPVHGPASLPTITPF